jgi:hypothetical protein
MKCFVVNILIPKSCHDIFSSFQILAFYLVRICGATSTLTYSVYLESLCP